VFRMKGYTRPLSILKLKTQARSKISRMSVSKLEKMLKPRDLSDGTVVAIEPSPCVDTSLLEEIYTWEENGATFEDILERLRLRCVPPGYTPTPWSSGMYGDISTN